MCSFILTNKKVSDDELHKANVFSQRRGPDSTRITRIDGITVLHNLLSITGEYTEQPFVKDDCVAVFNGELYNYKDFGDYKSDGECIIDAYKEYGPLFHREFDGEFAIVLIDLKNDMQLMCSDIFCTKPMYYSSDGKNSDDWAVCSYKSSIESLGLQGFIYPNYMRGRNVDSFDLNQHKDTYDDWINAFSNAIRKRTQNTNEKIFLGLSAGYDSGAIANELTKQGVDFKAYSIRANEDKKILKARHKLLKNGEIIKLTKEEYKNTKRWIKENCEDFEYTDKFNTYNIKKDKASVGLGAVCSRAQKEGRKIYFSGQGSDEIISDYGHKGKKIYTHSEFGGKFPEKLEGFFPWHSFFDGTQIKYLNKEEMVSGAYGVETRYPYLDRQVVQEFLYLTPELKNKHYKAPLREYLKINGYPFQEGIKTGFRASDNLK